MPASLNHSRRLHAFLEGRRASVHKSPICPFSNPKLQQLWNEGLEQQRSGKLPPPTPAKLPPIKAKKPPQRGGGYRRW